MVISPMTIEQRAKAIADSTGLIPGSTNHRKLEAFALRMLREACAEFAAGAAFALFGKTEQ